MINLDSIEGREATQPIGPQSPVLRELLQPNREVFDRINLWATALIIYHAILVFALAIILFFLAPSGSPLIYQAIGFVVICTLFIVTGIALQKRARYGHVLLYSTLVLYAALSWYSGGGVLLMMTFSLLFGEFGSLLLFGALLIPLLIPYVIAYKLWKLLRSVQPNV